jgi:hypothetical protein
MEKEVRFIAKKRRDGSGRFAAAGIWCGGICEKGDKRGAEAIPAAAAAIDLPLLLCNLFLGCSESQNKPLGCTGN